MVASGRVGSPYWGRLYRYLAGRTYQAGSAQPIDIQALLSVSCHNSPLHHWGNDGAVRDDESQHAVTTKGSGKTRKSTDETRSQEKEELIFLRRALIR